LHLDPARPIPFTGVVVTVFTHPPEENDLLACGVVGEARSLPRRRARLGICRGELVPALTVPLPDIVEVGEASSDVPTSSEENDPLAGSVVREGGMPPVGWVLLGFRRRDVRPPHAIPLPGIAIGDLGARPSEEDDARSDGI